MHPSGILFRTAPWPHNAVSQLKSVFPDISDYTALHYLINHEGLQFHNDQHVRIEEIEEVNQFNHTRVQAEEIMQRYARIKQVMQQTITEPDPLQKTLFTERLDNILLHRVWGYVILLAVLFLLFQSVFWLAQFPMDGLDWTFTKMSTWVSAQLPDGWFRDLMVNGLLAGLSGILVFIPQIMILFGLITVLEDTGYMARISFLTDKLMRKVGLNGKSVMPMISGFACAVPAIMSARNIENKKERLLTILVTPLMSCSARLPVYTMLIALVVPNQTGAGIFQYPGTGDDGTIPDGHGCRADRFLCSQTVHPFERKKFFHPGIAGVPRAALEKCRRHHGQKAKIFVRDAGKVIIVISMILWGLSTYGPPDRMRAAAAKYSAPSQSKAKGAALLENSYAGILGRTIEPAIKPLGYDWKIGIA